MRSREPAAAVSRVECRQSLDLKLGGVGLDYGGAGPFLQSHITIVSRIVEDIIEGRHEVHFRSAKLCLEGAKTLPRMVRLIGGSDAPQVIPLMAQRFGFAHDLEMKQIRGHHVAVNVP